MTGISIEDGFNFAIGQWLAEWAMAGVSLLIIGGICLVGYVGYKIYEKVR